MALDAQTDPPDAGRGNENQTAPTVIKLIFVIQ